jgi:hypothetical protein
MNVYSGSGGNIGQLSDANGILAEIRKACDAEPSIVLIFAVTKAYKKIAGPNIKIWPY